MRTNVQSLGPTWGEKKPGIMVPFFNSRTEKKKRQVGLWHLLVSQPGLLGEFEASEKAPVKK